MEMPSQAFGSYGFCSSYVVFWIICFTRWQFVRASLQQNLPKSMPSVSDSVFSIKIYSVIFFARPLILQDSIHEEFFVCVSSPSIESKAVVPASAQFHILMNADAHMRESCLIAEREDQKELENGMIEDMRTERTFYLDVLPFEVLNNLLTLLSCVPNAKSGERHIALHHIIGLVRTIDSFRSVVKNLYNELCISRTVDCMHENHALKWELKKKEVLWTDDVNLAHEFLMAGGGEDLQALQVGFGMYRDGMAELFRDKCPNLKSLSVVDNNSQWIRIFGESLEKLDYLECYKALPFHIATYCLNLKGLVLNSRQLSLENSRLWERIGGTLELLTIAEICCPSTREIEKITGHCRKLRRISIRGMDEEGNDAVSTLLASYGSQLQWAEICDLTASQLRAVAASCRQASFNLYTKLPCLMLPSLQIIGHQLEIVKMEYEFDGVNTQGIVNGWKKCVNLREVFFHGCRAANVRSVFSTAKPHIKKLYFRELFRNGVEMQNIMDMLCQGAVNVEEFTMDCQEASNYSWGSLAQFFELNKSTLSYVALRQPYSNDKVHELLHILLQSFALKETRFMFAPGEKLLETLIDRGIRCREWNGMFYYK